MLNRNLGMILKTTLFGSAFLALYHDTITHMVVSSLTSEGSHVPLILAVTLYLIWHKRHDIKALQVKPVIFPGLLICGVGCFVLFAGKLSNTILLQQVSIVPFLLGAILLLLGFEYFKALLLPVGYLIFLTGIVEALLASLAIYFQLIAAWIASHLLELSGMPVVLTETIVALPHISLEVVKSCSGISHIVSLMALSIPLAIMSQLTPARKVILVVASFFIGIFANGVRIASIGIYALYNKGADLHGPNETLYVTFIFFFGMVLLIILSQLLSKKKDSAHYTSIVAGDMGGANNETEKPVTVQNTFSVKSSIAWVVFGILFFVTLGFSLFYKVGTFPLPQSIEMFPKEIANFSSRDLNRFDQRLRPFAADHELKRLYFDASGNRFEVYIGYFQEQTRERKLIDYRRRWMHEEAHQLSITTPAGPVTINQTRMRDNFSSQDVYFWYVMNNRIITSQYAGKMYTFLDGLFKRRTNGAVVVVQPRSSQKEVMPFLEGLVPEVLEHLGDGVK